MAVRRGTATPSKVFRGTVPVKKIYRGNTLVWSASIYPVSGNWGPVSVSFGYATYASHTTVESGTFTIVHTTSGTSSPRIVGPWGTTSGTTTTQALAAGATINFQATGNMATSSGSWSIVKN